MITPCTINDNFYAMLATVLFCVAMYYLEVTRPHQCFRSCTVVVAILVGILTLIIGGDEKSWWYSATHICYVFAAIYDIVQLILYLNNNTCANISAKMQTVLLLIVMWRWWLFRECYQYCYLHV